MGWSRVYCNLFYRKNVIDTINCYAITNSQYCQLKIIMKLNIKMRIYITIGRGT